jgi:type IV pilus assembly protein PilM
VGIFAVKSDVVASELEHFSRENIRVGYVQMAPMALYNYILYDRPDLCKSDTQATVILNIGAENSDLVVCTKSTVWQRCIPMGGNAFTKAIADAFKLNFEKAEKLKRTAAMSKYARQILQAMKPVFTDLSSEIQRSLGFYSSSNPNTKLSGIIALGGGTKMRGLLKYLQQVLQMPIERPDSFKKLAISASVSAAKFHESVCDFGIVYGLALQGLGLGRIESNLLPRGIARSMAWVSKARYLTAAACVLLVVSVLCLARTIFDKASYSNRAGIRQEVKGVIEAVGQADSKLQAEESKAAGFESAIQKQFEPFKYRDVIPLLHQTIISTLPNEKNNPEQKKLYSAFAEGDVETVLNFPRNQRKQVFITGMSVYFADDIAIARFGATGFQMARGSGGSKSVSGGYEGYDAEAAAWYEGSGAASKYAPVVQTRTVGPGAAAQPQTAGGGPGFVVTIAGYSPYKDIGELMDPVAASDDPNRWGVITRLMHLDEIVDGNCPFELYERTKPEHFNLETGDVDWSAQLPVGIGIVKDAGLDKVSKGGRLPGSKPVLIDPMTKEVISKVAELDEHGREKIDRMGSIIYQVNDHWFVLNLKLVWKDAPKEQTTAGSG